MTIQFTTDPDAKAVGLDTMYVFPATIEAGAQYENIGKLVQDAAKKSSAKFIGAIQKPGLTLSAKVDKLWLIFNESTNTTAAGYAIVADLHDFGLDLFDPDYLGPLSAVVPDDAAASVRITRLIYSHNLNPDVRGSNGHNIFGFTDDELGQGKLNLDWPFGFGAGMLATCELEFAGTTTEFPLVYKVPGYTGAGTIASADEASGVLVERIKRYENEAAAKRAKAQKVQEGLAKQSGSTPKSLAPSQRKGPVALNAVTVTFKGMSIELDVTASVSLGPLQGRIINFQLELFLEHMPPRVRFDLDGVGFAFESPAFTLAGALLKTKATYQLEDPRPPKATLERTSTMYNGGLILKTPLTGFAAIASFSWIEVVDWGDQPARPADLKTHHEPSLFLYAMMHSKAGITFYNIVTISGLALTFGYNRDFKVPSDTGDIPSHPLIALVQAGGPPKDADDGGNDDKPAAKSAAKPGGAANQAAGARPAKKKAVQVDRPEAGDVEFDGGGDLDALIKVLASLKEYVPIVPHNVVAGAGVMGDVAKLVELFLMPVVSFNFDTGAVSVQLYGTASLGLPKGASDDATVLKLNAAMAAEIPITGDKPLMIGLAITDGSFVLRPFVSIEGGLAFYHTKDVTLFTMGGYGPLYRNAQPNWPVTAPVGISMNLSDLPAVRISMRGRLYFSFLPDGIAFGVDFQGLAEIGGDHFSVGASYDVGAHALLMWAPFFYEVEMHANFALRVRVSLTVGKGWFSVTMSKSLSFDLSAKLHMWGNEQEKLNGRAELTVHVLFTFHPTVEWGEPIGDFFPISWKEFKEQFVPHAGDQPDALASGQAQVTDGVIDHHGEDKVPVVSPEKFEAQATVFFPPTKATMNGKAHDLAQKPVGIQMIGLTSDEYSAPMSVTLTHADGVEVDEHRLEVEVIEQNLPIALWKPAKHKGMGSAPSPSGPTSIQDAPVGLRIRTTSPVPHATNSVDKANLDFDIDEGADIRCGPSGRIARGSKSTEEAVTAAMNDRPPDSGLLAAFGIEGRAEFAPLKDTDLIGVPHLV